VYNNNNTSFLHKGFSGYLNGICLAKVFGWWMP